MKKVFAIIAISGLLLMSGCSGGEDNVEIPSGIIPPDTMIPLLVDMHLVEAAIQDKKDQKQDVTEMSVNYYNVTFKKYNVTRNRFESSEDFYSLHPKLYREMYDQVMSDLSKKQSEALQ